MEFKDRLKSRRLELGKTLEDIARSVGVSGATVQRWESGAIKNLRRDKIAALAEALETTPEYLMGWGDNKQFDTTIQELEKYYDNLKKKFVEVSVYDDLLQEKRKQRDSMVKETNELVQNIMSLFGITPDPITKDYFVKEFPIIEKKVKDTIERLTPDDLNSFRSELDSLLRLYNEKSKSIDDIDEEIEEGKAKIGHDLLTLSEELKTAIELEKEVELDAKEKNNPERTGGGDDSAKK